MQVLTNEAVQWFAPSGAPVQWGVIFPTALGWMGFVWGEDGLQQSTFGHAHASAVRTTLGIAPGESRADWRLISGGSAESPVQQARRKPEARRVVKLIERLQRFADLGHEDFADVPLATQNHTDFQRRVLEACRSIPVGQTLTYRELAALVGSAGAARAVGNVMASNRFAPIVPCHRVVGSGGGLGGYSAPAGLTLKRKLLDAEAKLAGESPALERRH